MLKSVIRGLSNLKSKIPQLLILVAILGALFYQYGNHLPTVLDSATPHPDSGVILPALRQFFPEAVAFRGSSDSTHTGEIYRQDRQVIGWFVCTSPYCDDLIGYAGPLPCLIVFGKNLIIKGIVLLPNTETEGFIRRIGKQGFFLNWDSLTIKQALDSKVETISGATMSSSAIKNSVLRRLSYLDASSPVAVSSGQTVGLITWLSWGILALSLYSYWKPQRMYRYRLWLLGICWFFLGFIGGSFLSFSLWFGWLSHGIVWKTSPWLVTVAVLAAILPLLSNRGFYCAYLCPYGAAQELMGRIKKNHWRLVPLTVDILQLVRRVFLLVILGMLMAGFSFDLAWIEPFAAFIFQSAARITLIVAGVFLLISVVIPRCWCRYLCPTGQILEFFCHRIRFPFVHPTKNKGD